MNESKNIESLYLTAQLFLDDLSSRPLTRQSVGNTPVGKFSNNHLPIMMNEEEIEIIRHNEDQAKSSAFIDESLFESCIARDDDCIAADE